MKSQVIIQSRKTDRPDSIKWTNKRPDNVDREKLVLVYIEADKSVLHVIDGILVPGE